MNPPLIKAIAVDDEPPALRVVESFCSRTDFIELRKAFNKPREALLYLEQNPVDLLFLDIHMPSTSGIDFYKGLQQEVMVIFTTAFSEYAVEGFNLSAVDYLLKPYTFERFTQAVQKARDYFNYLHATEKTDHPVLYIRADYSLVKIDARDILLIEAYDDYVKIHVRDQKTVVARMTLKILLDKLPEGRFVRIHRSYIVPMDRIRQVSAKSVFLDDRELPLGGSYKEDLMDRFGD